MVKEHFAPLTNSIKTLNSGMVQSLSEHMRMENAKKEHSLGQEETNTLELIETIKDGMEK